MGKYIHKFKTTSEFENKYNWSYYSQPWVSYTSEDKKMHYDQLKESDVSNLREYFTIEGTQANTDVYLVGRWADYWGRYIGYSIDYSTDNGSSWTKVTFSSDTIESFGDNEEYNYELPVRLFIARIQNSTKLLLRADCLAYGAEDTGYSPQNPGISFYATKPCYVYGNTSSLIKSKDFEYIMGLESCAFAYLFFEGSWVLSKTGEKLLLPVKNTGWAAYYNMFKNCTNLQVAPEIYATIIGDSACREMFAGCTSLTTPPPELLAENMYGSCYQSMFSGCTSLTTTPKIFGTIAGQYCCAGMFRDCTSLTTAFDLPATDLTAAGGYQPGNYCYSSMFEGCTSLTTAPALPATTLSMNCYNNMFEGCTSLTDAPELLATTLPYGCYEGMFKNCSNLIHIKCFATSITSNRTTNWVSGVAAGGYFEKAENVTWPSGVNGIPENWITGSFGISTTRLKTSLEGGTINLLGYSKYSWSLTNNESWITVGGQCNTGIINIPLTIDSTNADRQAVIYASCPELNQQVSITIIQTANVGTYSVNLQGEWIADTNHGPNGETIYKSNYNYHTELDTDDDDYDGPTTSSARMKITIEGYTTFTLKVRTNGENNYDYLVVSKLDKTPARSSSSTNNQWHGQGKASASTWYDVTFDNISSGQHVITLLYTKDDSDSSGEDRGFVYVPIEFQ